jgi:lycopene beta-cyclase
MADIAIIGGGLSGLSLAVRLCAPAFAGLRITLFMSRRSAVQSKTWCYWSRAAHPSGHPAAHSAVHPFQSCVDASWSHGTVAWPTAAGRQVVRLDFSATPYERIREDSLIAVALEKIGRSPQFTVVDDADITRLETDARGVTHLYAGRRQFSARLVFDSRPPVPSGRAWRQVFAGGEYVFPAESRARIDKSGASTFVMMDFQHVSQSNGESGGGDFLYVLPASDNTALIQATAFVPPGARAPSPLALQAQVTRFLHDTGVHPVTCLRDEHGVIPMDDGIAPTRRLSAVTAIGARGGFIRASTGYSFSRTQRACDALTEAIAEWANTGCHDIPLRPWQSPLAPWLDRVFLDALAARRIVLADTIGRLAAGVGGDRLVRFLDGDPQMRDLLAVMGNMPKMPLLWSALASNGRHAATSTANQRVTS